MTCTFRVSHGYHPYRWGCENIKHESRKAVCIKCGVSGWISKKFSAGGIIGQIGGVAATLHMLCDQFLRDHGITPDFHRP